MTTTTSRLIKLIGKQATEISPGSFQARMDSTLLSNIKAVALKSVAFANLRYNVRTGISDTFRINANATNYDFVVPAGFYSITQVLTYLQGVIQTQLTALFAGTVLTMILDPATKKIIVKNTIGSVIWGGGNLNPLLGNTSNQTSPANTNTQFIDFADFNGLDSVQITIKTKSPKTILNATGEKLKYTNSLGTVYVEVGFGEIQTWYASDLDGAKLIFGYPENLDIIEFKLRDSTGEVIENIKDHLIIELIIWTA